MPGVAVSSLLHPVACSPADYRTCAQVKRVWNGFYSRWQEPAATEIQRWWRSVSLLSTHTCDCELKRIQAADNLGQHTPRRLPRGFPTVCLHSLRILQGLCSTEAGSGSEEGPSAAQGASYPSVPYRECVQSHTTAVARLRRQRDSKNTPTSCDYHTEPLEGERPVLSALLLQDLHK